MRDIKFRAWNKEEKRMIENASNLLLFQDWFCEASPEYLEARKVYELMQYTGLKDKNVPSKEVYEGDIIDSNGKITGNIYEMDKGKTDFVIEGFGTKTWCATYQEAVARGCTDAE